MAQNRRTACLTGGLALIIIGVPTVSGVARAGAYAIETPMDQFALGVEFLALLFPLLAGLVATTRLNEEVAEHFLRSVRTRTAIRRYVTGNLLRAAATSSAVFFTAIFTWFLVAFFFAPSLGLFRDPGNTYSTQADAISAAAGTTTFAQLLEISPWLYGLVYSAWVGSWAITWATLTALLLMVVPNRVVAYVIPLAAFWVENIVLSNVGQEIWRSTYSAFPFGLTQQPIAVAFAPWAVWILIVCTLRWWLHRNNYETGPLT